MPASPTPAAIISHPAVNSAQHQPGTATITTTSISLDPVTGQPLGANAPKPCCHKGGHAHVVAASDSLYPRGLLTLLGTGLLSAGIVYGLYRWYQYQQQKQLPSSASSSSSTDSYPVRVVHDEADFDRVLTSVTTQAASQHRSVYVLVEGAHDPLTDLSWCPDCQQADPIIHAVLSQYKQHVILIRAPVTRAHYKNNPSHPYRQHPQLLLQRIPTLYHFRNGQVVGQLIETELHDVQKVQTFLQQQQLLV